MFCGDNIKNALSKDLKNNAYKNRLKMRNSVNNWNSLLDQRKVKENHAKHLL